MAGNRISVSLDFIANTNQAESALKSLQTSLNSISNMSSFGQDSVMARNIEEAASAAMTLRNNLQAAFDQKTGTLNLTRLNEEMSKSGMSAEKYRTTLSAIGPEGKKAFMDLANAVVASETPLRQSSVLVDKLWDTLKRTAGWQLSSSLIHGFMSGVQTAYNYAQDLNRSLNDIRIVTGYNTDKMADFAVEANKAAKALSSTTVDYTNASLIYFQQGLDDEAVKERTDVTIKMANVTQTSAEQVSQQMTAVWNNFDDGSKSLEYYADVMTALGAATASSTDEIADGLEKFAAVADTVGLSYEYATAALATVTATTRQSADVVGTAFKTLFARIESLKLGETLDDGTTLGSYSEALASVGVNIKEANGDLKNMDDILEDTAATWDTLSKDQQVALAQSVAGVRQYTQFIALMDNWDFMKENLQVVAGATGTLQEQADIYADSWQAAQKRVQAAAESIYDDLLDDRFFITITDGFALLLNTVDKLIDSFGGLGGTLPLILSLVNRLFGDKILESSQRLAENIYMTTDAGKRARAQSDMATKNRFINETVAMQSTGAGVQEGAAAEAGYSKIAAIQMEMIQNADTLTEKERNSYKMSLNRLTVLTEQATAMGRQADEAARLAENERMDVEIRAENRSGQGHEQLANAFRTPGATGDDLVQTSSTDQLAALRESISLIQGEEVALDNLEAAYDNLSAVQRQYSGDLTADLEIIRNYNTSIGELQVVVDSIEQSQGQMSSSIAKGSEDFEKARQILIEYIAQAKELGVTNIGIKPNAIKNVDTLREAFNRLKAAIKEFQTQQGRASREFSGVIERMYDTSGVEDYAEAVQQVGEANRRATGATRGLETGLSGVAKAAVDSAMSIDTAHERIVLATNALSQFASLAMNISMVISSFKSILSTIQDDDISVFEKIERVLMSTAMLIPAVLGSLRGISAGFKGMAAAATGYELVQSLVNSGLERNTAIGLAKILLDKKMSAADKEVAAAEFLSASGVSADTTAKIADTVATTAAAGATFTFAEALGVVWGLLWSILPIILAIAAALTLLVARIKAVVDAYHEDENAAKRAAEAERQAVEACNDLKQAQQELIDTFDEYDEGIKKIDELREGTEEWTKAVQENNRTVLDLLDKYPELAQHISNAGGKLEISDAGRAIVEKNMSQQVAQAENVVSRAQIRSNSASLTSETTDLRRETRYEDYYYDRNKKQRKVSTEMSTDEMDKFLKVFAEKGSTMFLDKETLSKALPNFNEGLIEEMINSSEQFIALGEKTDEVNRVNELLRDTIADNTFATSDLSEEIKAAYGGDVQKDYEEEYNKIYEDKRSSLGQETDMRANFLGLFANGTSKGKDYFNQWAQNQQGKDYKIENFSGKDVEYSYMLDGEEKTGHISYERLFDELAEILTKESPELKALQERDGQLLEALTQLQTSDDRDTSILGDILKGEDGISYSDWLAANTLTDAELSEIYKQNKETLQALGYNTVEEFINGAREKIASIEDDAKASQGAVASAYENYMGAQAHYGEVAENSANTQHSENYTGQDVTQALGASREAYAQLTEAINDARGAQADFVASSEGLDVGKIKEYQEVLAENADKMDNVDASVKNNISKQKMLATQSAQTQQGIEALTDAFKDYGESIDASTAEGQRAMKTFKSATAQILNMSDELEEAGVNFSDAFIENNLADLKLAAENDTDAIDRLHKAAAEDIFVQVGLKNGLTEEEIAALQQELNSQINEIQTQLQDFEVGADLDTGGFLDKCTELVNAAGMTAEQATAYLASMGIDAEVIPVPGETVEDTHTYEVPKWGTNSEGYVEMQGTETYDFHHSSTGGTVGSALKVVSATKSSGGGVTYGKGGLGSGGGKKSSGGGGGGSKQKKKDLTKRDDVVERYHRVSDTLDNLTKQYDKLSNATEHAFGVKKLKLMDQQITKLKQMASTQKDYLAEVEKYLGEDRTAVIEIGAEIDENGVITNYEQIAEGWLQRINDLENAYNAGSIDDDTFEERKKVIDEEQEILKQYEETYDLWLDKQDEIAEAVAAIVQAELDQVQVKVDLVISETELSSTINDFMKAQLADSHTSFAAGLDTIISDMTDIEKQYRANEDAIQKILDNAVADGRMSAEQYNKYMVAIQQGAWETAAAILQSTQLTQEEISAMTSYATDMMEQLTHYHELREDLINLFVEGMASNNKMVQLNLESFEQFGGLLSHYVSLVDLLGKKLPKSREIKASLLETNFVNTKDELAARRKVYEEDAREYKLLQEKLQKERLEISAHGNAKELEAFDLLAEETLGEARAAMVEAQNAFMESFNEAAEAAQEKFSNMLDIISEDFANTVAGMSFDALDDKLERIQDEQRDRYVADYKAIYEINKLNRELAQAMDDTTNIAAKNKLKSLQADINKEAGDYSKLTEHDLEYLEKQFEIQKAKIALEEAQNAKNTVRLRRDNEGNWGYVYTADEDNTAKAQEDYEKALFEMAESQDKYLDEMSKKWFETEQEFIEKYTEVANDMNLTEEERKVRLAELTEFYTDKLDFIKDEMEKNVDRNMELYDTDYRALYDTVGKMSAGNADLQTSFEQTIVGIVTKNEEGFEGLAANAHQAIQETTSRIDQALDDFNNDLDETLGDAGYAMDTFSETMQDDLKPVEQATKDSKTALEKLIDEIKDDYSPQNVQNFTDTLGLWVNKFYDLEKGATSFAASLRELYSLMNQHVAWDDSRDYNAEMQKMLEDTGGTALGTSAYNQLVLARRQKVYDKGGSLEDADNFQKVIDQYGMLLQTGITTEERDAFLTYLNQLSWESATPEKKNAVLKILRDRYGLLRLMLLVVWPPLPAPLGWMVLQVILSQC